MGALPKKAKKNAAQTTSGWPLVVWVWSVGIGLSGYVAGRLILYSFPHPVHWGAGLVGAVIGIGIGWLWYRAKGDIL